MKNIRIDDVIVARSDADAAEPLPDGLTRERYNDPIIVRDDMVLVDGLRRLRWHQQRGRETVRAIVVSTFLEAMEALAPQHTDRQITPLRLWNMVSVLDQYNRAWIRRKADGGWARNEDGTLTRTNRSGPGGGQKTEETSTRLQYRKALNVPQHTLQSTLFMYARADSGDTVAQELVDRVNRGEIHVQRANREYKAPNNLTGNVTNAAEQQRILERGATELQAHVSVLQRLGHPLQVSTEEITEALSGLVKARTELTKVVSSLRKVLNERENNGQ